MKFQLKQSLVEGLVLKISISRYLRSHVLIINVDTVFIVSHMLLALTVGMCGRPFLGSDVAAESEIP